MNFILRKDINSRIEKFIFSSFEKDERFMKACLVITIMNDVDPNCYTIKHLKLSEKYEQYIVSENKPSDLWRNKELNDALQAVIMKWFRSKYEYMHTYVDNGEFAVFTLTKQI